jgi:MoaA/NifB/PqqE/SkfB family radical SAM enzyme
MTFQKNIPPSVFKYNNRVYNEKIYRLYRWMHGEEAPPYKLIVVPTNRCNLLCYCCPNAYARSAGRFRVEDELTDEQWLAIVDEGLKIGIKEWYILGGGEPFMRKELVHRIVRMIKEDSFFNICEIITNGTLWNEDDVKEIISLKLDRLLISIDSCDSLHDYLRRTEGAFEKAKSTLSLFKKYKQLLKSDKPIIQMNVVLNNRNYIQIKEIIKFAIDLDVDELAYHPMREYEETRDLMKHLKLTSDQEKVLYSNVIESKRLTRGTKLTLDISMIEESHNALFPGLTNMPADNTTEKDSNRNISVNYLHTRCFEPFYSMFIDPKGNVNYCCAAGDGKEENNIKSSSIEKMWYGKFFGDVRKSVISGGKTDSCERCGLLDMTKELRQDICKYMMYIEGQNENRTG